MFWRGIMKKLNGKGLIYTWVIMIIMFTSIIFFSGCGKKKEDKVVRIGVTISNPEDRFIEYMKSGMDKYAENLGPAIEVEYLDAKMDVSKQIEHVKYFVEKEMDAIVVLIVDQKTTSEMTKLALKAKIPLVYANNFPEEFKDKEIPKGIHILRYNGKKAGELQMEYLAERLNGKGNVAILMGALGNIGSYERTEGVEEIAEKYPGINIVKKESARWLAPLASSVVEEWLNTGVEFDAIAANNDEMAIGAIRVLEKYGKAEEVIVVGVDGTPEGVAELKSGKLAATVLQSSYGQGKDSLDAAFKAAKGEAVPSEIWMPVQLLTLKNYQEVLKRLED
jgi:inositol transport system substrate-binding protein